VSRQPQGGRRSGLDWHPSSYEHRLFRQGSQGRCGDDLRAVCHAQDLSRVYASVGTAIRSRHRLGSLAKVAHRLVVNDPHIADHPDERCKRGGELYGGLWTGIGVRGARR